jgi:hypothetical protein
MRKQPEIRLRRQQTLDALLMNCLRFQGLGRLENEGGVYQLLAILTKGFVVEPLSRCRYFVGSNSYQAHRIVTERPEETRMRRLSSARAKCEKIRDWSTRSYDSAVRSPESEGATAAYSRARRGSWQVEVARFFREQPSWPCFRSRHRVLNPPEERRATEH